MAIIDAREGNDVQRGRGRGEGSVEVVLDVCQVPKNLRCRPVAGQYRWQDHNNHSTKWALIALELTHLQFRVSLINTSNAANLSSDHTSPTEVGQQRGGALHIPWWPGKRSASAAGGKNGSSIYGFEGFRPRNCLRPLPFPRR